MFKATIKMTMLLSLWVLALAFSSGANAMFRGGVQFCSGNQPQSGEVFVYTGQYYTGTCYLLFTHDPSEKWSSYDANDTKGFPNDQIQSVWVGPDVTLVLFWSPFKMQDHGQPLHFGPGEFSSNLGSWNRNASAVRVQTFPFGQCGSTESITHPLIANPWWNDAGGMVSIFADPFWTGDCTELNASLTYPNAVAMGFRNDTVSAVVNASDHYFDLFFGTLYPLQWPQAYFHMPPMSWSGDMKNIYLPDGSIMTVSGFNDVTSSAAGET